LPYAQQNAVVKKQCASCHTDALMYGGLSLEHYDATTFGSQSIGDAREQDYKRILAKGGQRGN